MPGMAYKCEGRLIASKSAGKGIIGTFIPKIYKLIGKEYITSYSEEFSVFIQLSSIVYLLTYLLTELSPS
jgi:hypothetical protein